MTGRLGQALRAAVHAVPPAPIPDDLFDRVRRRRRRSARLVLAAAVALVVVGAGLLPVPLPGPGRDSAAGNDRGGLPSRLYVPPGRTATVGVSAPGAAAAIFGGDATVDEYDEGRFAVVARDDDRYRVFDEFEYTPPGFGALLSPDGRHVARNGGLRSLTRAWSLTKVLPGPPADPLAFSPDGTRLVTTSLYGGREVTDHVEVHRLDTDSRPLRIPVGTAWIAPGWTAAVSADNGTLALQVGSEVWLVRLDAAAGLVPDRRMPLAGGRLAGPGSWRPDGGALMVAEPRGDGWRLTALDAATGARLAEPRFPDLPKTTYVRIVGWRSADTVVALVGVPGAVPETSDDVEQAGGVFREWNTTVVRLVELHRGATEPRLVLQTPPGISELDVAADLAVSGAIRPAGEPSYGPLKQIFTLTGGGVLILISLLALTAFRLIRDRIPRRRPDA